MTRSFGRTRPPLSNVRQCRLAAAPAPTLRVGPMAPEAAPLPGEQREECQGETPSGSPRPGRGPRRPGWRAVEQQRSETESEYPKAVQNTPQELILWTGGAQPLIPTPVATRASRTSPAASVVASALLQAG